MEIQMVGEEHISFHQYLLWNWKVLVYDFANLECMRCTECNIYLVTPCTTSTIAQCELQLSVHDLLHFNVCCTQFPNASSHTNFCSMVLVFQTRISLSEVISSSNSSSPRDGWMISRFASHSCGPDFEPPHGDRLL
jgi:hypothetical protein